MEAPIFGWHYRILREWSPTSRSRSKKHILPGKVPCFEHRTLRFWVAWKLLSRKTVMFPSVATLKYVLMFGSVWVNVLSLGGEWRGPYKRVDPQEERSNAREEAKGASLWANQVGGSKRPRERNRKNMRKQTKKQLLSGMVLLPARRCAWYVANHCWARSWSPN